MRDVENNPGLPDRQSREKGKPETYDDTTREHHRKGEASRCRPRQWKASWRFASTDLRIPDHRRFVSIHLLPGRTDPLFTIDAGALAPHDVDGFQAARLGPWSPSVNVPVVGKPVRRRRGPAAVSGNASLRYVRPLLGSDRGGRPRGTMAHEPEDRTGTFLASDAFEGEAIEGIRGRTG